MRVLRGAFNSWLLLVYLLVLYLLPALQRCGCARRQRLLQAREPICLSQQHPLPPLSRAPPTWRRASWNLTNLEPLVCIVGACTQRLPSALRCASIGTKVLRWG